jgi:hypothetical protein
MVSYIVIECTAVISLDSTAIHMLEGLHREFKERGIRVCFAAVGNRMDKDLRRAGLVDKIGAKWFHASVHGAVRFCISHRARNRGNAALDDDEVTEEDLLSELGEMIEVRWAHGGCARAAVAMGRRAEARRARGGDCA